MLFSKNIAASIITILALLGGHHPALAGEGIAKGSQTAAKLAPTNSLEKVNASLGKYGRATVIVRFDQDFGADDYRNVLDKSLPSVDVKGKSTSGSFPILKPVGIVQRTVAELQEKLVASVSGNTPSILAQMKIRRMRNLPLIVMRVNSNELKLIGNDKSVRHIQFDESAPATLIESTPLVGMNRMFEAGGTGGNMIVAILDSGVDLTNNFNNVVGGACFSTNNDDENIASLCPSGESQELGGLAGDNCGDVASACDHGTHVAGIAAGNGTLPSFVFFSSEATGVAKNASIFSYQVFRKFNSEETCESQGGPPCLLSSASNQIAAMDDLIGRTDASGVVINGGSQSNGKRVAAVNLSIGGGEFSQRCDSDNRKVAIDALFAKRIATVISSGNEGFTDAVGAPACISSAITVGSTTKNDDLSSFSNSSTMIDLLAPGEGILSSLPGNNGAGGSKSGTSMAAPHVAGAFAALRGVFPNKTIFQIGSALRSTGLRVNDSRPGGTHVNRRIRVFEACKQLGDGVCETPPGILFISPLSGFTSIKPEDGIFGPLFKTYTITNIGGERSGYTLSENIEGMALSNTSGDLGPLESRRIDIAVDATANTLAPGFRRIGALTFTDITNGRQQQIPLELVAEGQNPYEVFPTTGFFVEGLVGGPFLPMVKDYTLKNTGKVNEKFAAFVSAVGATVLPEKGELKPGASVILRVSVNKDANSIPVGKESKGLLSIVRQANPNSGNSVLFAATSAPPSSQVITREIKISARAPVTGKLEVSAGDLASTGPKGGPFVPADKVYTLRNTGKQMLNFTASETIKGMTVSPKSGAIAVGKTVNVTVVVNAEGNALAAGTSEGGVLTITDTSNSVSFTRNLKLDVDKAIAANDNILNAKTVTGIAGSDISEKNTSYSMQTGERRHGGTGTIANGRSAWWKFIAPADAQMEFNSASSIGDTVIAAYVAAGKTPTVTNITQLVANDNGAGGSDGKIFINVEKDVTYYLAIAARNVGEKAIGTYTLRWSKGSGTTAGLLAAVLPGARSVKTGEIGTAFATLFNTSTTNATNCSISLPGVPYGSSLFQYQTTDGANKPVGTKNTPVNIDAGKFQGFVFGMTPGSNITNGADAKLVFDCENMAPVTSINGLNTMLLSSATAQPADMVAIADTLGKNGIADIPGNTGTGFFVAAVVNNNGPSTLITATLDTGRKTLPVTFTLCQSNAKGACLNPPSSSVTFTATSNTPNTFTIFVNGTGNVPFDPANNRAFLRFKQGSITRGATSVAIRTQ